MKMRNIFLSLCMIALTVSVGCTDQDNKQLGTQDPPSLKVLRVGFPPDENPQIIIEKNTPLLEYLKAKTGLERIEISVPDSYTAAIEAMEKRELDMVYFGGLTYVLAKSAVDITPLVRGVVNGTPDNYTYIIARKDSGIEKLKDLRGRSFAFGDVASTSGHLIPHGALLKAGLDPGQDFKQVVYTGAHDKTAFAVFKGEVEAGAMNARLFPKLVETGQIKEDEMRVIWKSEPFADYPWAIRSNVGQELIQKLTWAFVDLKDPQMLQLLGVEAYERSKDSDFDNIRRAALTLGFM